MLVAKSLAVVATAATIVGAVVTLPDGVSRSPSVASITQTPGKGDRLETRAYGQAPCQLQPGTVDQACMRLILAHPGEMREVRYVTTTADTQDGTTIVTKQAVAR